MMDIRLTDGALADLRTIEAQIGLQSHRQAAAMIERIYERFDGLASFPRLGPMVHERNDENLRELLEESYRIIYRIIDEGRIDIVAVVHAARRLPKGL